MRVVRFAPQDDSWDDFGLLRMTAVRFGLLRKTLEDVEALLLDLFELILHLHHDLLNLSVIRL